MAQTSANQSSKEALSTEQYSGKVPYSDLSKFYQDTRSRRISLLPPGAGADQCCGQYVNFALYENIWIFTKSTLLYKNKYTTGKEATLY